MLPSGTGDRNCRARGDMSLDGLPSELIGLVTRGTTGDIGQNDGGSICELNEPTFSDGEINDAFCKRTIRVISVTCQTYSSIIIHRFTNS